MPENRSNTPAAGTGAPSPFAGPPSAGDRWVRRAILLVALALVAVVAWLGFNYYQDMRLATSEAPSARAVSNLRNIVTKDPDNALARVRLAEAMMANDQAEEAVEQLQQALKIDKDNIPALMDLGLVAMDRTEWQKAEGYWRRVIDLLKSNEMASQDKRLASAHYDLGTTLVELKRYEEAVAELKESIRIKRDASPVHYMLSVAYARLNLAEQQKKELQIVVAFDPQEPQANYDLGRLLLKEGDAAGAAELFRIAADRAPDEIDLPQQALDEFGDAPAHLSTARRLQAKEPKKALDEARIAAAIDPSSADAVRLTAVLWERAGDAKRAQNAWERLLELIPGDAKAASEIKRLNPNGN